jgi:hypothetical protein
MAWNFGDSFDLYAAVADAYAGYWDSGVATNLTFVAGRFTGSQALNFGGVSTGWVKSSATNDAVHHLVVSYRQTAALSGTTLGGYIELFDGTTAQCSIVFRSDGAILLTSGGPTGTALATFTGAITATSTWYGIEFEVVINSATGSFAVRKNGNTVNDFSATSLNTQVSANAYANKIQIGMNAAVNAQQYDDLFWRSGAATGNWLGDIRCYARMPASDQSVQFTKSPVSVVTTPFTFNSTFNTSQSQYSPITAAFNGTVNSATISVAAGFTGNLKCAVFNDASGAPGTVLASATAPINNPATGVNTFSFTPFAVVRGVQYWIGCCADGTYSPGLNFASGLAGRNTTAVSYAAFPVGPPPSQSSGGPLLISWTVTLGNYSTVQEPQQDGLTSYVYDSNPGDADFYGLASIASTPATVIATTVRGYMQKSDAGTRTAAVQLKSGATTVASPTLVLTSSGWLWAWRTDLTDPNTGAAWTPAAVNNAQIGPVTIA